MILYILCCYFSKWSFDLKIINPPGMQSCKASCNFISRGFFYMVGVSWLFLEFFPSTLVSWESLKLADTKPKIDIGWCFWVLAWMHQMHSGSDPNAKNVYCCIDSKPVISMAFDLAVCKHRLRNNELQINIFRLSLSFYNEMCEVFSFSLIM